jgi:hypothetical protein
MNTSIKTYVIDTSPRRQNLLPMWPARLKELSTPEVVNMYLSFSMFMPTKSKILTTESFEYMFWPDIQLFRLSKYSRKVLFMEKKFGSACQKMKLEF